MRAIIVFLLIISSVSATSFTLMNQGSFTLDGETIYANINTRGNEDFQAALEVYYNTKSTTNNEDVIADALENAAQELNVSKRDDTVYIRTPWQNFTLRYKNCNRINQYEFCFTSSTYLEEDIEPFGDEKLNTVKIENGAVLIPFVITVTTIEPDLSASRVVSANSVLRGTQVSITVSITNKGTESSERIELRDTVPFSISKGETSINIGSLAAGESASYAYTFTPLISGVYSITTIGTLSVPNATINVSEPIDLEWQMKNETFVDEAIQFTLTINNYNDKNLTVKKASILSDATYKEALIGEGKAEYETNGRSLSDFTIGAKSSRTINGSVTPTMPREYDIKTLLSYTWDGMETIESTNRFNAKTRDLEFSITNDTTITVTLKNNLKTAAQDVTLIFSDRTIKLATLQPGDEKILSYPLAGVSTVTLTYVADGVNKKKTIKIGDDSLAVEEPVSQTNSSETTSDTDAGIEQEQTNPDVPNGEIPPAQPEQSVFKRFFAWIKSLF